MAIPHAAWIGTPISAVMTSADRVGTIGAAHPASQALDDLVRRDVDQLAVIDSSGALVGLVGRRDIVQWLSIHTDGSRRRGGGTLAHRNA